MIFGEIDHDFRMNQILNSLISTFRSSFCSEGDGGGGVGYPGNQSWGGVPSIEMDDPENSAEYAAMDFNTTGTAAAGATRNTAIPIPKGSVGTGMGLDLMLFQFCIKVLIIFPS